MLFRICVPSTLGRSSTYPEGPFTSRRSGVVIPEEQPQDILVVLELYVTPVNAFLRVDRLLRREDERVEEILQLLVGHVDAQLLKAVVDEVLEAGQVEDADGVGGGGAAT